MPTKAEMYAQMAEKVAVQLTGSWQEWAGFLTNAARLYKYPFHEQLMIYAQRPDATACAEYDLWNNRMGRYLSLIHICFTGTGFPLTSLPLRTPGRSSPTPISSWKP